MAAQKVELLDQSSIAASPSSPQSLQFQPIKEVLEVLALWFSNKGEGKLKEKDDAFDEHEDQNGHAENRLLGEVSITSHHGAAAAPGMLSGFRLRRNEEERRPV